MLLSIQIAAGIVLAYVIIVNQQAILKSIRWLASAVFGLLILGVVLWGASAAVSTSAPHIGFILSKVLFYVGVITILALGALGGFGLWVLIHEVLKRERKPMADAMTVVMGFANMLLVWLVTWPLLTYTGAGQWYAGVDHWSRANGFADGGSIAIASIWWLWPWIPLLIIWRRRSRVQAAKVEALDA